ncbi:hypothetical protein [Clostridium sp.]|uniref:SpaA isopeptide-forming pilin-related protein n=1 Tax=Clostridium sp. TaxID=1506 RepID=UPI0026076BD9|nr:hypothetical protein [Clostridium sp.]
MKIKVEENFNLEDILEYKVEENINIIRNSEKVTCYEEVKEIENNMLVSERKGKIEVRVRLGSKDGSTIKGAKINLYLLKGVQPKIVKSKFTDDFGKVTFEDLEDGCYRVISIVNREYFDKPIYRTWNEFNVDENNKYAKIEVVNKIKINK